MKGYGISVHVREERLEELKQKEHKYDEAKKILEVIQSKINQTGWVSIGHLGSHKKILISREMIDKINKLMEG